MTASWSNRLPFIVTLVLCAGSFFLQTLYLGQAEAINTDEGDHLYAARLLAQGVLPYVDFAYLHPPAMISIIAAGYKTFGSVFALRMSYLALNLSAVVLMFFVIRRILGNNWLALLGCLFYLTYHEFFHHDGRFIALRQFTSSILLIYLFILTGFSRKRWFPYVLAGILTFLAMLSFQGWFTAGLFMTGWALHQRVDCSSQLVRRIAPSFTCLAVSSLVLAAFLAFVPNAFEQTVLEHFRFWKVPLKYRLVPFHDWHGMEIYLFLLGSCGLLMGIVTHSGSRFYCLAGLLSILSVLLPREFFVHYYTLMAFPFVLGACVFASRIGGGLELIARGTGVGLMVFLTLCHCNRVAPSLLGEWLGNRKPAHHDLVAFLKRQPEPFLTFMNPVLAFEADKDMTRHFYMTTMRLFRMTYDRYDRGYYDHLVASSCTVVLTRSDKDFLKSDQLDSWFRKHRSMLIDGQVTVLLNDSPRCRGSDFKERREIELES